MDELRFEGRTVIVTGGVRGVGRACATLLDHGVVVGESTPEAYARRWDEILAADHLTLPRTARATAVARRSAEPGVTD
jgi:NAD(P)-dependent dehydrogenase (short-subunit alcohol dehydrogenase family)